MARDWMPITMDNRLSHQPNQLVAAPAAKFFPRLEALRGCAALMVAAYHVAADVSATAGDGQTPFADPGSSGHELAGVLTRAYWSLMNGNRAVTVFFVLSGFVLTLSLARCDNWGPPLGVRFAIARLFRIYPAVIFAVVVMVVARIAAAMPADPPGSASTVLANMLLLDTSLNGVMWSLQLEVLATPLILGCWFARRRWPRHAIAFGLGVAVTLAALAFAGEWTRLLQPQGPAIDRTYAFVFGILIVDFGPLIAPALTPRRATLLALGAIAMLFGAQPVLGSMSHWAALADAYAAAALILCIAYGPRIALLHPLDTRLLRFFGRVSYSLYLLHPAALITLDAAQPQVRLLLDLGIPQLVIAPALFVLSAAAVAPLAAMSYAFVERSGIAAGRMLVAHLGARREPRSA